MSEMTQERIKEIEARAEYERKCGTVEMMVKPKDLTALCEALREANKLLVSLDKSLKDAWSLRSPDTLKAYLRKHGYIEDQKEADDEDKRTD